MPTTLEMALAYRAAGLSVLPIRNDGSKRPALDTWDELKARLPTEQELSEWFVGAVLPGVGIIGGAVSGGLAILDFEFADLWEEYWQLAEVLAPGVIEALPLVRTPGKEPSGAGGRHLY